MTMSKLRLRRPIGIISVSGLAFLAAVSVSPGAMAATTTQSHTISVHSVTPDAAGHLRPGQVNAVPDQIVGYSVLQNVSNDDCLNGTLALVYMTPCSDTDSHVLWGAIEYDVNGYLAYQLQNGANGECLNGYTGSAHAEVTLTPCDSGSDAHMLWYPLGYSNGVDLYQNVSNGDCLNGYTGSAHAEVTLTPCDNGSDAHTRWINSFPF